MYSKLSRVSVPPNNVQSGRRIFRGPFWRTSLILIAVVIIIFLLSLKLNKSASTIEIGNESRATQQLVEMEKKQSDEDLLNEITLIQDNFERLEQSDPKLIRYIRARYLTPPTSHLQHGSKPTVPTTRQGRWVRNFFRDKQSGVFLEAGANDGGDTASHTLALELELGWTGVLIECNPFVTPKLRGAGRKAWVATVCLSTTAYPQVTTMSIPDTWAYSARLGPAWDLSTFGVNSNWTVFSGIETVPLYSILAAVGIKEIDYFSFDVEGSEFSVLKSFPFDKVLIKVLIMEVYFYSAAEKKELKTFLGKNGLVFVKGIEMDEIYVHNSLLKDGVTVEDLAKL